MYRVNINLKSFNPRAINASINSIKKIKQSLNSLADHLAESTAILKPARLDQVESCKKKNSSKTEMPQNGLF